MQVSLVSQGDCFESVP